MRRKLLQSIHVTWEKGSCKCEICSELLAVLVYTYGGAQGDSEAAKDDGEEYH